MPQLKRAHREKYETSVVFDDCLEVGLFLHERNKLTGEVPSYMKFTINSFLPAAPNSHCSLGILLAARRYNDRS